MPFKRKTHRKWRIAMNRNASKWKNGTTLGLIGGGISLLAGTTYYFMKRQGGSFTHQGQRPSRSHISMS
jgi:hypothetical protein